MTSVQTNTPAVHRVRRHLVRVHRPPARRVLPPVPVARPPAPRVAVQVAPVHHRPHRAPAVRVPRRRPARRLRAVRAPVPLHQAPAVGEVARPAISASWLSGRSCSHDAFQNPTFAADSIASTARFGRESNEYNQAGGKYKVARKRIAPRAETATVAKAGCVRSKTGSQKPEPKRPGLRGAFPRWSSRINEYARAREMSVAASIMTRKRSETLPLLNGGGYGCTSPQPQNGMPNQSAALTALDIFQTSAAWDRRYPMVARRTSTSPPLV